MMTARQYRELLDAIRSASMHAEVEGAHKTAAKLHAIFRELMARRDAEVHGL